MNQAHIKAILDGVVPELKSAIAKATQPLIDRIEALEKREPIKGEKGDPGALGVPGPQGEKGDPGAEGPPGSAGERGADGAPGPHGERGADGIAGAQGDPGSQGEKGADGIAGLQGERGSDGAAGAPGEIGPRGEKALDGAPGRDGQPGVPGSSGRDGADGAPGLNGKDGFSLDDFTVLTEDGGRTFVLAFQRGDQMLRHDCKTDIVLDRGVWKDGAFAKGDGVTWGGSFWIAQKDTSTKPDTPNGDWRLAVKRGRDGKDGKPGEKGMQGLKGEKGDVGPRGYGV